MFSGSLNTGTFAQRESTLGMRILDLLEHVQSLPDTQEILIEVVLTS